MNKDQNIQVCVIIVSYNFEPWLDRCLSSLLVSSIGLHVMVIDNRSTDETVKRIKEDYPQVLLVENKTNLGFGRANNIGLNYAIEQGYDYVFLMNQDAWIDKTSIEQLIEAAHQHPEFGIISPVHLSPLRPLLDHGFANYSNCATTKQLPQPEERLIELPFINAAFWLLPIETVRKVGGFSPLFFHYGEDRDYLLRARFHHFKVGYLPAARATHDRDSRKATAETFLKAEYIYFLSELSNINYPLSKAIAYSMLASIKKMLIAISKGKGYEATSYLKICFLLLIKLPKAISTRKVTKEQGAHYL